MSKKTLVLGTSATPIKYSYKAVKKLLKYGHEVVAIGKSEFEIDSVHVTNQQVDIDNLDTITIYMSADKQESYCEYILKLKPRRIIFNPGSYNQKLKKMAEEQGIEVIEDCTLVMLDTDDY
jgi:uncharacterized protein